MEREPTEPTNAQIWANLGYFYIEIGRLDKAELCADRLRTLDVEHARLLRFAIDNPDMHSRGVAEFFGVK